MWIEPATVPPLKPSFEAVASSWIEPFDWAAELTGMRSSPVTSAVSVTRLLVVVSWARSPLAGVSLGLPQDHSREERAVNAA
jgi:hypothetical protein